MMLQEDLNVPVASPMALLSIFRYVLADGPENPEPWEPQAPAPKEEPEDDVKIRVDFLDSEFTDDHFDLKKKEHLLGKTLVQLSRKQGEQPVFKSLELLGWILFEKWDHVLDTPHTTEVAKDCLDKAKDLVNASEFEQKESVLKHLEEFKASDSLDTGEILTDLIKSAVKEHEPRYIQSQVENFQSWERAREAEMKKQLELYNRESRIEEIKRRKREFEEREKKLFFFERQDEFEQFKEDKILAWRKQLPRRTWTKPITRKKREVVSDNYIPPE